MSLTVSPKALFVASGLVALLGAGGVYTSFTGLSDEEAKVAALRTKVRDEKDVRLELEKTTTDVVGLRAKLKHLEEGVPNFAYIPSMAKELELAGRSHGIEVLGVRPVADPAAKKEVAGEKKTRKAYEELTIQVKGRGSYTAIANFVRSLTNFPKIVAVRMLTLTPKASSEDPFAAPKLDADIEIRAYAFKDSGPAAEASPVFGDESAAGAKPQWRRANPKTGKLDAPGAALPYDPAAPKASPRFSVPEDAPQGGKKPAPKTPRPNATVAEASHSAATRMEPTRFNPSGEGSARRGDRHGS